MRIEEYKRDLRGSPKECTLVFLVRENEVLLGRRKSGVGKGKWVGIGGMIEKEESVEEAAVRETFEEIGVKPQVIKRVATLNFYLPYAEDPDYWNQRVCVFIATGWEGEISESREISPKWFRFGEIPYGEMWPDAHHWLPEVLNGGLLKAEFLFNRDTEIIDKRAVKGEY